MFVKFLEKTICFMICVKKIKKCLMKSHPKSRGGARERVSLMHFYTIFYVYNLA
jgi:hypothetical protein